MNFAKWIRQTLFPAPRQEVPNLYAQLCNIQLGFDLSGMDASQLKHLYGNSVRLVEAVIGELERRGVDVVDVLERTRGQIESGDLRERP